MPNAKVVINTPKSGLENFIIQFSPKPKKKEKAEKSLACQSVIKTFWFCWREKMLNAHNELTV